MQRDLKFRSGRSLRPHKGQRGYMLITLVLALALITIALLAVLPDISQQIKRDRENELMHRGTAYMRAIQHFYRKFGRYPTRIEELENTNNIRFLRKRYTDPMIVDRETGKEKDFKFLHPTDVNLSNGPVLAQPPGQSPLPGQNGLQGQSALGATPGGLSGLQSALSGLGTQSGGIQQQSSGDGADSNSTGSSSSNSNSNSGSNTQTFGGGPIIGVASTSTAKTIRVFYQKNHYKDWLFIYVPPDRGAALLTGPVNPGFPGNTPGGTTGLAPGLPVSGAPGQGGFGQGVSPNNGQSQNQQSQPSPNSTSPPPN
jgi:type II secretory pathway pseudopilin PulG